MSNRTINRLAPEIHKKVLNGSYACAVEMIGEESKF